MSLTDEHWQAYQHRLDETWQALERDRFEPMREWQTQVFAADIDPALPLYYPFGGPDMIHALMLYPHNREYVLFGLEPPGSFHLDPQTPAAERYQLLDAVQWALRDIYQRSYFITGRMSSDLNRPQLNGVLPLLLVFIARAGYEVMAIEEGTLTPDGEFAAKSAPDAKQEPVPEQEPVQVPMQEQEQEPDQKQTQKQEQALGKLDDDPSTTHALADAMVSAPVTATSSCPDIRGVRVRFRANENAPEKQTTYLQIDVSDAKLGDCTALETYLKRLAPTNTFVKSASYLMHYGTFSRIRALTLAVSDSIFQDDTGVPYRDLDQADWDIVLFGSYTQPIKDFSGVFQPDLNQAYLTKAQRVAELPFEMGYHWWTSAQNHLLARKRAKTAETLVEDATKPQR
ncbi:MULTISPECIES: hypothetical protein [Thiorhodovibrio]|uniref:hypothetical protein n=1 Tax=Thiorhodovibrio TaxID=61593 RepID=UPI001911E17C|nr:MULTISPECIES: hypothetical protein [Thiorhodovibrio]